MSYPAKKQVLSKLFLTLSLSTIAPIVLGYKPNPVHPAYLFDKDIRKMFLIIKDSLSKKPGYRYMRPEYLGRSVIMSKNAQYVLSQKGNENDIYLYYSGPIGKSKTYVDKSGNPLDYYADFHLHLVEVGNKTQVEIITLNPLVVTGRSMFPSLPHFVRKDITAKVEPSGYEEAEILALIAKYSLDIKAKILMPVTTKKVVK